MDWIYQRRRVPEWKQGWRDRTIASSVSAPPVHLLTILAIVIVLLWLSQYTDYKAQLHHASSNVQLLLFLTPLLIIVLMAFYSSLRTSGVSGFKLPRLGEASCGGASPWIVAFLLVLILALLSYRSVFRSKWFGPLGRPG